MRRALAALVLTLVSGGASCAYTFRQDAVRPVVGDGIHARIAETTVHVDGDGTVWSISVTVVVGRPAAGPLRESWLADPATERCSGGLEATHVTRHVLRDHPPSAETTFTVGFGHLADAPRSDRGSSPTQIEVRSAAYLSRPIEDAAPRVIDLLFARGSDRTCLRLPFSGVAGTTTPQWRRTFLGFVGMSTRIPVLQWGPKLGGATVSVIAGGWVGPVRLWLEPGLVTSGDAIGISANAEWVFFQRGQVAVGLSAGYSAYSVGTTMSPLHGPGSALRLKWTLPRWLGATNFPGGPQTGFAEVFLPVDLWSSNAGAPSGLSFGIGFAVKP